MIFHFIAWPKIFPYPGALLKALFVSGGSLETFIVLSNLFDGPVIFAVYLVLQGVWMAVAHHYWMNFLDWLGGWWPSWIAGHRFLKARSPVSKWQSFVEGVRTLVAIPYATFLSLIFALIFFYSIAPEVVGVESLEPKQKVQVAIKVLVNFIILGLGQASLNAKGVDWGGEVSKEFSLVFNYFGVLWFFCLLGVYNMDVHTRLRSAEKKRKRQHDRQINLLAKIFTKNNPLNIPFKWWKWRRK